MRRSIRIGLREAVTAALLAALLAASPAAAFLPGRLDPGRETELRRAGFEDTPVARAFHLPDSTSEAPYVYHLLVILVEFADVRANRAANSPAAWFERIFGQGGAAPSLAEYYRDSSGGRFQLRGQVTPWVRVDSTYAWYTSEGPRNAGGGVDPDAYPHNVQRLVEEAVSRIRDDYDWPEFDNNRDGLVDGLLVVHAGPGVDESVPPDDPQSRLRIVAHKYTTSFDVPVAGSRVLDYATVEEAAPLGVTAHEFGHLLGLIDLYHTGIFAGVNGPFGLGDWSLMGTGALLAGGRRPSRLDPWSRLRLGFTRAEVIDGASGESRVTLVPGAPAVLRLWGAAGQEEYFLAEARTQSGFDAYLPGSGVLIYHVDDAIEGNFSSAHYRVALMQADGSNDLGSLDGNRGDAGDPYPSGYTSNDRFDDSSLPSSRSYSRSSSYVALSGIRKIGVGYVMTVRMDTPARPRLTAFVVRESAGNGDGFVDPGEEGVVDVTVENQGAAITTEDLSLAFSAADPDIGMLVSLKAIGNLPRGAEVSLPEAFRFRVRSNRPASAPGDVFRTVFAFTPCLSCPPTIVEDSVLVALGPPAPFEEDFTAPVTGWTHQSLRFSNPDLWHVTTRFAHSPPACMFFGYDSGQIYDNRLDAGLVSPVFQVPPAGQLSFWQRVDAETLSSGRAWDGGVVEISVGGGPWQPIEPAGGYPYRIETGTGNTLFGRGAFSGHDADFSRAVFDLSAYSGSAARLRFRFASNAFVATSTPQTLRGWLIDDVRVGGDPRRLMLSAVPVQEEVVVRGRLTGGAGPAAVRLWRQPDLEDAAPTLVATDIPLEADRTFTIHDSPASGRWIYRARLLDADGPGLEFAAPVVVVPDAGQRPRLASPYPNPFHPSGPPLSIDYFVPEASRGRRMSLDIIDVQGRRVARLLDKTAEPGAGRVQWPATAEPGQIRAGLYFALLRIDGQSQVSRRVIVVP